MYITFIIFHYDVRKGLVETTYGIDIYIYIYLYIYIYVCVCVCVSVCSSYRNCVLSLNLAYKATT
jgi:hypothetical protein